MYAMLQPWRSQLEGRYGGVWKNVGGVQRAGGKGSSGRGDRGKSSLVARLVKGNSVHHATYG